MKALLAPCALPICPSCSRVMQLVIATPMESENAVVSCPGWDCKLKRKLFLMPVETTVLVEVTEETIAPEKDFAIEHHDGAGGPRFTEVR